MEKLSKLQTQISLERKYASPSDDPIALIYSRSARSRLRQVDNYKKNVETAKTWITSAETALMDINEVLKNSMEQAVSAANDINNDYDRQNFAVYIQQMRDHLISTLNTTQGDKFIFGGYNTTGRLENGMVVTPFQMVSDIPYGVTLSADADLVSDGVQDGLISIGAGYTLDINGLNANPPTPATLSNGTVTFNDVNSRLTKIDGGAIRIDLEGLYTNTTGTKVLDEVVADVSGATPSVTTSTVEHRSDVTFNGADIFNMSGLNNVNSDNFKSYASQVLTLDVGTGVEMQLTFKVLKSVV
jgi:flagellin-like hook-associated protein FlgL